MFNGIKGLDVLAARLGTTLEERVKAEQEARAKEERREKMRALGAKGNAAKRAKEDPVALALKARAAGCNDAKSVAAWIARYKSKGTAAANAGPRASPPRPTAKELARRAAEGVAIREHRGDRDGSGCPPDAVTP